MAGDKRWAGMGLRLPGIALVVIVAKFVKCCGIVSESRGRELAAIVVKMGAEEEGRLVRREEGGNVARVQEEEGRLVRREEGGNVDRVQEEEGRLVRREEGGNVDRVQEEGRGAAKIEEEGKAARNDVGARLGNMDWEEVRVEKLVEGVRVEKMDVGVREEKMEVGVSVAMMEEGVSVARPWSPLSMTKCVVVAGRLGSITSLWVFWCFLRLETCLRQI